MSGKDSPVRLLKWAFILFLLFSGSQVFAGWQDLPLYDPEGGALFDYATMLSRTILFYDANRCGPEVTETGRFNWRGDCHVNDGIQWTLKDGSKIWIDATGGYHDAGDHIKFGITNAYAPSTLGWGFYEFRSEYEETGQDVWLLRAVKWATDYYIRCHPEPDAFLYSVGSNEDHNFWGPPELQSDIKSPRDIVVATPSNPASDVCGSTAATLAQMSVNYRHIDAAYADLCLEHGRQIWELGRRNIGLSNGLAFYPPSTLWDDLAWGAIWLYVATGEEYYLDEFAICVGPQGGGLDPDGDISNGIDWDNQWVHCWDTVWGGAFAVAAAVTKHPAYVEQAKLSLDFWINKVPETPGGLKYLNGWGVLRYSTAAALQALSFYNNFPTAENEIYRNFGGAQMSYALGSNPMDRCYIVGVGNNPPIHPHHDAAHGSDNGFLEDPPFHKHVLYGALCGGPGTDDVHNDAVDDYIQNEVSIDYNAAVVGALAGMRRFFGDDTVPEPDPTPEPPIEGIYMMASIQKDNAERTQINAYIHNHTVHPPHFESQLSYRYFVDMSEVFNQGYDLSNLKIETVVNEKSEGVVSPVLKPWDELHHIYYLEVSYPGVQLYNRRELQFGLILQTPNYAGKWDSSNDFSIQGVGASAAINPYMPVYRDGVKIWGEEPYKDTVPPAVPAGLIADAVGSSQINLDWADGSDSDIDFYNIYRSEAALFPCDETTYVGSSQTSSFSDTGLQAVTTYFYKVTAVDDSLNESIATGAVEVTTLIPDTLPPGAPMGLYVSSLAPEATGLDWKDNTDLDISKYRIYRDVVSGFICGAANLAGESLNSHFTDRGLNSEKIYYYKVVAVDTSGNSSTPSGEASAMTLPPAPPALRLQYSCSETAASSELGRFNIYLYNEGTTTVALTDLTVRYRFTSEVPLSQLSGNCDYSDLGHSNVRFAFGDSGSSQYMDVTFASSALVPTWKGGDGSSNSFPGGASTGEIQCRFYTGGQGFFNQSDDWSFDPLKTSPADWERIEILYKGSTVCWGVSPSTSDNKVPVVSGPADLFLLPGSTGNSINWVAMDANPGTYRISLNSAIVASGSWSAGSVISYSVDGLASGVYSYVITLSDQAGNSVSDGVLVSVSSGGDPTPPAVTSPEDIAFTVGASGNTIVWTPTDSDPGTFSVTRNGSVVRNGAWVSGIPIILSVDGLAAGSYLYKIVLVDQAGNNVSDTVTVTVTPSQGGLNGDVNGSGVVDIVDALMTAQYYVGLTPPGFNSAVADVNHSGTIDIIDALIIAQYYVGLIPAL